MENSWIQKYQNWKYKNTFFLILSLALFFYFADTPLVKNLIAKVGELGYLGAFITGVFFVSTFTVAPAAVVLFFLADKFNPLEVSLLAGTGAVLGDYLIFRFLKDKVFEELKPVFSKLSDGYFNKLFKTPYFAWMLPVIGAAIIASPLPDEMGIGILGISGMKTWQFLLLSFFLNSIGIFIIVIFARSL